MYTLFPHFRSSLSVTLSTPATPSLSYLPNLAPRPAANRIPAYAAACSSLDFSLRLFRPMDMSKFHLIEQHTECGANARTFSVGRVYDDQGRQVAHSSQSSIMRPPDGEGWPSVDEIYVEGNGERGMGTHEAKGVEAHQVKSRTAKL